jgi:hypothetical protein
MSTTPAPATERRENHKIREVFAQACALLAPIVAGNDNVKTISNFAMAHMVQEHFPELTSAEVHIVILTVEKIHREERLQAILNKKG